ncbi:MAG: hypothetical protein QGF90_13825 [Gammaproteobacteria bacterium]|nr:hypothetical protein [Gammaproteobacteria bacterium]|tara:strand:+ start:2890 stop:3642 length:753 start_codon:yes stop_codon:yes gene_type:complete
MAIVIDKKLIAEAMTVVASILLAFIIDAWWEERSEKAELTELLSVFLIEISENIQLVEGDVSFREAKSASAQRILKLASESTIDSISISELDGLINDLTYWGYMRFATDVLNSIITTGQLTSMESVGLKFSLTSWQDELDYYRRVEQQDYDSYQTKLLPYLAESSNLMQINNASDGKPGTPVDYPTCEFPTIRMRDHRTLLNDDTFLSLVTITAWDQADFELLFRNFLTRARNLEILILNHPGFTGDSIL